MGIFDIFQTNDPAKIEKQILDLEAKKAQKAADFKTSKDDLINYDLKIRKLKIRLCELKGLPIPEDKPKDPWS